MKAKKKGLLLIPLAAAVVGLAVWGPEELARYRDEGVVGQIKSQESGAGTEGYRYALSSRDKISILSECLNQQVLPESDLSARTKTEEGGGKTKRTLPARTCQSPRGSNCAARELASLRRWGSCPGM